MKIVLFIPTSQDMICGSNELIYVPGSPLPITIEECEDDDEEDAPPTAPPRSKTKTSPETEKVLIEAFTDDPPPDQTPQTLPRNKKYQIKTTDSDSSSQILSHPYATINPKTITITSSPFTVSII